MPYEGEYASYGPLRRVADSERVQSLLKRCQRRESDAPDQPANLIAPAPVRPSAWAPDYIIAIDGSHAEVTVENGFPGAEVSYVTVACVILDAARMRKFDSLRPVDPRDFRTLESPASIDCVIPGCNVVIDGEAGAAASMRKLVFEEFKREAMAEDCESLLDTFEVLLSHKPASAREQRCPYDDCPTQARYRPANGTVSCACSLKRPLYSTDALRFHEGMNAAGTNGAMFAEIMQVYERVWIVHILRTLEAKGWLSSLSRVAFVLDGPLALFGHPAWVSQAVSKELMRLNGAVQKATGGRDLLLLGIEKTGMFVDHFASLDLDVKTNAARFPNQAVLLPTDDYIHRNVIFSEGKEYGKDTYFGRKVFYKTKSGARLVATLPYLADDHRDLSRADVSQFPRLADAMSLMDQVVSSRYPNALVPLVSAHAEAAIPLHLGRKVLEQLAKTLMKSSHG